jgi:hypothetical protein
MRKIIIILLTSTSCDVFILQKLVQLRQIKTCRITAKINRKQCCYLRFTAWVLFLGLLSESMNYKQKCKLYTTFARHYYNARDQV